MQPEQLTFRADTAQSRWLDEAEARLMDLLPKCQVAFGKFTADDFHALLPAPAHRNWWGCLLARLRGKGLIRCIGQECSHRPAANGRKVSVWELTNKG